MHIVLPKWMAHLTEKGRQMPIYSIHAHPLFQKVATAGQGKLFPKSDEGNVFFWYGSRY